MIRDKVLGYLVGGVFVWPYPGIDDLAEAETE